jgi:hypothetical protein
MGSIVSAVGNILGSNQANNQQQQGYSNASGILNDRYGRADTQIMEGYNNARGRLEQAYPTATGTLQPYANLGGASTNALSDLIGSGYATKQFSTADLNSQLAPNYEFLKGQLQGTTNAAQNTGGGLLSGNALQALQSNVGNFAQNAYQQAFNNYNTQRNSIFSNLNNAGQMASANTNNLSGLQSGYGGAQAGLDINQAQNQANLNTALGQSLAGNNINAGNAAAKNTMYQYNQGGNALSDLAGGDSGSIGSAIGNIGKFFSLG